MAGLSIILTFVASFAFANAAGGGGLEEVVIGLPQGKLVGVKLFTTESLKPYYAFSNIPYAKPPLGNLRFKPPQDPAPWKGTRVVKLTPMCYQWIRVFNTSTFFGQEDCLYANVYTPVLSENAKLPVMVCIHGGDFQRGSSYECPANNFMDKNLVFVSFNYRLGVFGFLSANDKLLPGNYGLKDQVAALKWVQKNIKNFGGDPNKVTIMGQGAGGASVHYHLYSSMSKGLFRAAISQSATALVSWALTPTDVAKNRTSALANLMKCPTESTGEILMCLSKSSSKILSEMQAELYTWFSEPNVIFSPTIESAAVIKEPFLTADPWVDEEVNKVPWIVGLTSGEGAFKSSAYFGNKGTLLNELNKEPCAALPIILSYDGTATKNDAHVITKAIYEFYFNGEPVTVKSAQRLINLFTDSMAFYGCAKAATRYSGKKYFYLFDHLNSQSNSYYLTTVSGLENFKMPTNGDEMTSLFYIPWMYMSRDNIKNDLNVSRRMVEYWSNFVKMSNPNGESEKVTWLRMRENDDYLRISTKNDSMETNLWKDRYEFWDKLPLRSKIQSVSSTKDEL